MEYVVNFIWDEEACVWVATSEDVPGLVLESGSFDALVELVHFAIPELLGMSEVVTSPIRLLYRSKVM